MGSPFRYRYLPPTNRHIMQLYICEHDMGFEIMRWDRCIRNVWRFSFSFKEVKSKLFWKVSHDLSAQRTKSTRILAAVACWNFQLTHKRLIVKNFDESCGCEKIMLRHCFWHSLKVTRWDGHSQKVSYPVNIHKSWMNPAQSCIAGSVVGWTKLRPGSVLNFHFEDQKVHQPLLKLEAYEILFQTLHWLTPCTLHKCTCIIYIGCQNLCTNCY